MTQYTTKLVYRVLAFPFILFIFIFDKLNRARKSIDTGLCDALDFWEGKFYD